MIIFAQYQYLLLILLVPVLFILYWLNRRNNRRRVAKLGDPALMDKLMPSRPKGKGYVKLAFFSLAWIFFSIGLARPQIGARLMENSKKGSEIIIALDVSNSMMAEDYSPNRLERAKLAISRLVDKLSGDRIGLVIFAGESFVQLPITTDYVSAKVFLKSISPESVSIQGTALADAIRTGMRSFSGEGQMATGNKAIIIITDGENHEDDPVVAASEAAAEGIKVFTIGVGTPEGKLIPMGDGSFMKDRDGNNVVTKLDETTLMEIAQAGDGAYVRAGNTEFGLNPIIDELKELQSQEYKSQVFEEFDEQYMYFFAVALFFFILEFLIGNRAARRRLFAVVGFILLSGMVTNASAQLDRSEVRKGNRLFNKNNYKEAEVEYRKGLIKDSLSLASNYNLASVLYLGNDAASAQKSLEAVKDTVSRIPNMIDWKKGRAVNKKSAPADYYHNLGNVYVKQKNWQGAVDAYKNSLRRNPTDMDTKTNLAYAQKMLKDQQQNQDQNQQNQNNDQNQDQNKDQNQNQDQNKDNNQDQNKDQNKDQNQDQNQDQNKDNNQNQDQNQQNQPQMSPQAAEQMLQAMQAKEDDTQDKVKKEKAKMVATRQKEKNW